MRQVCVEIPEEDRTATDRQSDNVGHLQMSLYGTRDAAQKWEEEYSRALQIMGLTKGRALPCAFWPPKLDARILGHGDDFTILATDRGRGGDGEEI